MLKAALIAICVLLAPMAAHLAATSSVAHTAMASDCVEDHASAINHNAHCCISVSAAPCRDGGGLSVFTPPQSETATAASDIMPAAGPVFGVFRPPRLA